MTKSLNPYQSVFFGTSSRSAKFLGLALKNGLKVDLVVSSPPKPFGKKQILTENPVVSVAKEKGIPFVLNLSDLSNLRNLTLGLILDFQQIIPNKIITLFSKGIINVHFSKLPELRGPAPVQHTILKGYKEGWISYYLISEKLDAGEIVAQTSIPLDFTENTETLYQKLIDKCSREVIKIISDYLTDRIKSCQQVGTASYTQKLTTENCRIDLNKPSEENDRLIRAAYPEPGAWSSVQISSQSAKIQKRLKILKAHLENEKLVLDIVQLEGKKPVTWKQFQEGYPGTDLTFIG